MNADAAVALADAAPASGRVRPRPARSSPRDALVRALARTADASRRRALLARTRHLHDGALAGRLHDEALRMARVDLARAGRLAQASRWIARRVGDHRARARSLRIDGHILSLGGRYRRALACYEAALALLESAEDAGERAITLSGALQTLIYLGEYDRAHQWASDARHVFAAGGDALRLARLDMNVGNVLFRQDRFREALARYQGAHEALVRVGNAGDVGIVLRNIAVCRISLNDFAAALDAYREARTWCEQHDMPLLVAEADYNVAYLHYLRGEYARAIQLYRAARAYCARVGDRYHQALCDLDQSEMFLELNLNAEGSQLALEACEMFKGLRMPYEQGKAQVNMGVAAARVGERRRALACFKEARELFGRERNRHWLTITDVYRALVLAEMGGTRVARRLCESSLVYFQREGPPGKAALCELMLARLALRTGDVAGARLSVEGAIRRAESGQATALAAQGYFVLGEILESAGDPEAAYASFRQAHAGLETLRSHIAGDQLKTAFLEDKLAVYESLVWLALQREPDLLRARVALRYIEQAKSRSLADVMIDGAPTPDSASADPAVVRRVTDLRRELTWWRRTLAVQESGPPSASRPASERTIRDRARQCEVRLARAQAELERADTEFRVMGSGHTLPIDVVRSAIPPGTALLEYYEARGTLLGCVLTRDHLEIVPLAPAAAVRTHLGLLQFQISKFLLDREYATRFAGALLQATTGHLRDLHALLVAPLLKHVSADHLVVVPHGALHYLPFHALFDGERFLIDRMAVSYAPSATVYYLCRTRATQSEARSLVLGVPDHRAPEILQEVRAVAAELPAPAVYIGAEATAARLRDLGRGARYVHVATHGLFRLDNPLFSAIRLGDGEMSLLDLHQLRLSADLVTLSGCGTGLNAVVGGDELVGLVRGLLYAGARAALVTLWDVHDDSTAVFMQSFYRHLATDAHKGRAMTAAMQELRAACPHPYFWAPFALVGDPEPPAYITRAFDAPIAGGQSGSTDGVRR